MAGEERNRRAGQFQRLVEIITDIVERAMLTLAIKILRALFGEDFTGVEHFAELQPEFCLTRHEMTAPFGFASAVDAEKHEILKCVSLQLRSEKIAWPSLGRGVNALFSLAFLV